MLLWLNLLVFGIGAAVLLGTRWNVSAPRIRVFSGVLALGMLAGGCFFWPGWIMATKTFAQLVMPAGLMWICLVTLTARALLLRRKQETRALASVLILFTLLGSPLVSGLLMGWLEWPFREIHPLRQGRFDAVIVLGGATTTGFQQYTYVHSTGDRIVLAARLYWGEHTPLLVCAGERGEWQDPKSLGPGEESQLILRQLGVPEHALLRIGGRNTREELAAAATLMGEHDWQRVGLLTSAWHLRRALRHADRSGLRVEPLPADFRGGVPSWEAWSLIPTATALAQNKAALHELIGMLVGR